jgi:hypothetical protein
MLRVQCSNCGRVVRGCDDWSGRSGNCPKCGAVIFFPTVGEDFPSPEALAALEPKTKSVAARVVSFLNPENAWTSTGWGAVVSAALLAITAWIWFWLVIELNFGGGVYHAGLRVVPAVRGRGVALNNGESLGIIWSVLFPTGFVVTWVVLMQGANYLVMRARSKAAIIAPIVLAGVFAFYEFVVSLDPKPYKMGHFEVPIARQAVGGLLGALLIGGLLAIRRILSAKLSGDSNSLDQSEEVVANGHAQRSD